MNSVNVDTIKEYEQINRTINEIHNYLNNEIDAIEELSKICFLKKREVEEKLIEYSSELEVKNVEDLKIYRQIMYRYEMLTKNTDVSNVSTTQIANIAKSINEMNYKVDILLRDITQRLLQYEEKSQEQSHTKQKKSFFPSFKSKLGSFKKSLLKKYPLKKKAEASRNLKLVSLASNKEQMQSLHNLIENISSNIEQNKKSVTQLSVQDCIKCVNNPTFKLDSSKTKINKSASAAFDAIDLISSIETQIKSLHTKIEKQKKLSLIRQGKALMLLQRKLVDLSKEVPRQLVKQAIS